MPLVDTPQLKHAIPIDLDNLALEVICYPCILRIFREKGIRMLFKELEIKPCGLGSRIRDMESYLISFLGESLVSRGMN